MKKIIIGADSAGYELKETFKKHLAELGYLIEDCGTDSTASCHYPVFAKAVAERVAAEEGTLGVLVCGTGIGMSMAANKVKGIRAAVCGDVFSATMCREHNDANVLCVGARVVGPSLALMILDAYLNTPFAGGRHAVRVGMISEMEG